MQNGMLLYNHYKIIRLVLSKSSFNINRSISKSIPFSREYNILDSIRDELYLLKLAVIRTSEKIEDEGGNEDGEDD